MSNFWTEERIDLLKKYWADGWSASEIEQKLGAPSRSAVIGKVYRLNLPQRPTRLASRGRVAAKPVAMRAGPAALPLPATITADEEIHDAPLSVEITAGGNDASGAIAAVMALRSHQCKFPIGDVGEADFRFCCAPRASQFGPYCVAHTKLTTQPAAVRTSVHARVSKQAMRA